jgi:capsular polysaccharide biosynthesis protein
LVGVRDEQIVIMDSDYKYVCEQVYVPRVNPAIFTPFLATIYDSLIASVGQVSIKPHKRILVSRAARTVWRNLANYDLICELLIREFGFELVEPDKLNIQDEIRLFQESAIVVGAEGAGLYNCCFMQSGTDVVALADQDYVMYVLGSMAEIRDFNVSYVFGESFQADSDLPRKLGHADFIVDPIRVKALVEELIRLRTIAH